MTPAPTHTNKTVKQYKTVSPAGLVVFFCVETDVLGLSSFTVTFFKGFRWRFLIGRGRSNIDVASCPWAASLGRLSTAVICVAVLLLLPLV